ncbi:MAG: hypothetical protein ABIL44_12740 [candidate division WOR-3 bacterium]
MNIKTEIVEILENFWPKNKAKGLLAQTIFSQEIDAGKFGRDAKEKLLPGCWLIAPQNVDFYKFRFCFFVHPKVIKTSNITADIRDLLGEKYRPFHAIAEFMNNAGIGIVYVLVQTENGDLPLDKIKKGNFEGVYWHFFSFEGGKFVAREPVEFFEKWEGNRGRASHGGGWAANVREKIQNLSNEILTELLLNEIFYAGLVKSILHKPLNDPYDVDFFLMSLSQKHIFPMEIKEKFPGQNRDERFFGIDAGRIMMLLRLCIPNDANAIYLIHEMDESGEFIGWKYMTLSDIIMTSSWNLQAGGPGMGGQSTQTIRLPYDHFKTFSSEELSEDNLKRIGNLPKDIKEMAKQFSAELSEKFHREIK